MTYRDLRTRSVHNVYNSTIREFVNHYRVGRPTIMLLPGGMGSQLDRSMEAYQRGQLPPTDYDTVWIDFGTIFLGQARSLMIETNGRDRDSHAIVANGPLRSPVNAYDATQQFFKDLDVNYVVFGHDWRRPLAEGAAFLEHFLTQLKDRVFAKHDENPLPNLTLLAHSQGGLVAKIFLHHVVDIGAWMKQLITVATPFYGTWSHQRRYFIGEQLLSAFYQPSEMAPIIATLPGLHNLMFLPRSTFDTHGKAMGLQQYPMRDPGGDVGPDPYDVGSLDHYPAWVSRQHLHDAGHICRTLAAALPSAVAQRVYNIRSIADDQTPVELVWHPLPTDFDPDKDNSPVQEGAVGSGDGPVPAWSAYHVSVPAMNQKELSNAVEHTYLMEDPQVLGLVEALINDRPMSEAEAAPAAAAPIPTASAKDVKALCDEIAASQASHNDSRLNDPQIWRGIYRELMRWSSDRQSQHWSYPPSWSRAKRQSLKSINSNCFVLRIKPWF